MLLQRQKAEWLTQAAARASRNCIKRCFWTWRSSTDTAFHMRQARLADAAEFAFAQTLGMISWLDVKLALPRMEVSNASLAHCWLTGVFTSSIDMPAALARMMWMILQPCIRPDQGPRNHQQYNLMLHPTSGHQSRLCRHMQRIMHLCTNTSKANFHLYLCSNLHYDSWNA